MTRLVSSWLELLSETSSTATTATSTTTATIALSSSSFTTSAQHLEMVQDTPGDSSFLVHYLKAEIKARYDPKLLSNVLSDSIVEPAWLTTMIQDRVWRRMLIELAEEHSVRVCSTKTRTKNDPS